MRHPFGRPISISIHQVRKWVQENKDPISAKLGATEFGILWRRVHLNVLDKTDRCQISVSLYKYGLTISQIAELYEVATTVVSNDLKEARTTIVGCRVNVKTGRKPANEYIYTPRRRGRSASGASVPEIPESTTTPEPLRFNGIALPDIMASIVWGFFHSFDATRMIGAVNRKPRSRAILATSLGMDPTSLFNNSMKDKIKTELAIMGIFVPASIIDTIVYYFYLKPSGVVCRTYQELNQQVYLYLDGLVRSSGSLHSAYMIFAGDYLDPLNISFGFMSFAIRYEKLKSVHQGTSGDD